MSQQNPIKSHLRYTYGCFSNLTFSQFVEIDEKFLDSDSVFGDQGLELFLNIKLNVHE